MNVTLEDNGITARELAYGELRRLLTNAGLKPGTRFGEIEWAERLGVHRGAVREAMAVLSHEDLLSRQGRGFVVPVLDEHEIQEIYQVRIALETAALHMIVNWNFDKEAIQSLESLCEAMQHLLDAELYLGFSEADTKFHTQLVELSGNSRLVKVYGLAPLPHSKYGGMLPENIREVACKAQEEHVQICQSLRDGRIFDAVDVLQQHLDVGWTILTPKKNPRSS